jgi:hypothetical protein
VSTIRSYIWIIEFPSRMWNILSTKPLIVNLSWHLSQHHSILLWFRFDFNFIGFGCNLGCFIRLIVQISQSINQSIEDDHQLILRRNVDREHQDIFRREIFFVKATEFESNELVWNRKDDWRMFSLFERMKWWSLRDWKLKKMSE